MGWRERERDIQSRVETSPRSICVFLYFFFFKFFQIYIYKYLRIKIILRRGRNEKNNSTRCLEWTRWTEEKKRKRHVSRDEYRRIDLVRRPQFRAIRSFLSTTYSCNEIINSGKVGSVGQARAVALCIFLAPPPTKSCSYLTRFLKETVES